MAIFLDRAIGAVPVVDDDGFPVGLVSKTDLVRHRYQNLDGDWVDPPPVDDGFHAAPADATSVQELMNPLAYTLRDHAPIADAAALMTIEHIHHLPVVGGDGRVVGMLSTFDFARWLSGRTD
jgi:CBS domain-containing protein